MQPSKSDLDRIQRVQNKALRIAGLSCRYTSSLDPHRRFNLLPLCLRRQQNLLKAVHTFMLHNSEEVSSSWGTPVSSTAIITRQADVPFVPLSRPLSTRFSNSGAYEGFKWWIELPSYIRREYDHNTF